MKYLITESQLDKVIFRYLNNRGFIKIDKGNRIYFVNSEGDEYAQIRFDKEDGWCNIYYKLVDEISDFFSLQESDSEQVIGRWVENTLQMRATNIELLVPYYWDAVENTLQMRVTNIKYVELKDAYKLRIPYK